MSVFNKEVHQHSTYGAVSLEQSDPYIQSLCKQSANVWTRIKCESTKVRNPELVKCQIKCENILQMPQNQHFIYG